MKAARQVIFFNLLWDHFVCLQVDGCDIGVWAVYLPVPSTHLFEVLSLRSLCWKERPTQSHELEGQRDYRGRHLHDGEFWNTQPLVGLRNNSLFFRSLHSPVVLLTVNPLFGYDVEFAWIEILPFAPHGKKDSVS